MMRGRRRGGHLVGKKKERDCSRPIGNQAIRGFLEQPLDLAGFVERDFGCRWDPRQTRHGHDLAGDRDDELGAV